MKYYLINGKIMKASTEMPIRNNEEENYRYLIQNWKKSLQPCSITDGELEKVKDYFKNIDFWDESKITDITELIRVINESYTHNGNILGECDKIYFKQPKQVGETEAVYTEKQVDDLIETICFRLRSGFFKSLDLKHKSIDRIKNEDYKNWKNEILKSKKIENGTKI